MKEYILSKEMQDYLNAVEMVTTASDLAVRHNTIEGEPTPMAKEVLEAAHKMSDSMLELISEHIYNCIIEGERTI